MDVYARWSIVLHLKMVHTPLKVLDNHTRMHAHGFGFFDKTDAFQCFRV